MTRVMAATGIDFEFSPAITPADRPLHYFSALDNWMFLLETGRHRPRDSEIACYASHLLLWKKCRELNEPIAVLEDDIEPAAEFAAVFGSLALLIRQFGFIRLDAPAAAPNYFSKLVPNDAQPMLVRQAKGLQILHPAFPSLGTGAYALSPAAADRLINASKKFRCPVDNFLRRTWAHQQPIFYIAPVAFKSAAVSADSQLSDRIANQPGSRVIRKIRRLPKRPYRLWARYASRRESARVRAQLTAD